LCGQGEGKISLDRGRSLCYTNRVPNKQNIAGWSSSVARRAHNPKVVGSNPAPATTLCDQKRYRTEKARNHAVSGLFSCPVLTAQKKDIFPPFTRVVRT